MCDTHTFTTMTVNCNHIDLPFFTMITRKCANSRWIKNLQLIIIRSSKYVQEEWGYVNINS